MTISIQLKGLGFIHMPEICYHPQMFSTNIRRGIENVEFYTHPTNMFPPPKYLAQISGQNLKMLGFVHILEICFHPTNVWHESWDRIENFGFYTHPINMFDDQSPICLQSIQSIQLGFSLSLKSESYSSFDIIAVCVGFYLVLEKDLCRKRQQ